MLWFSELNLFKPSFLVVYSVVGRALFPLSLSVFCSAEGGVLRVPTWVRSLGWEESLEKEKLPTPVFWPGEFHGLCSTLGRKESDTTERLLLLVPEF